MAEIRWPLNFPVVLQDKEVMQNVARVVRSNNLSLLVEIARQLFKRFIRGNDFVVAFQRYLDLCLTIDSVKCVVIGKDGSTLTSNLLMRALACLFAVHPDTGRSELEAVSTLTRQLQSANGVESWFFSKTRALEWLMENSVSTREFAHGVTIPEAAASLEDCSKQISLVQEQIQGLMAELSQLRRYGVKMSFFQDGILHNPADAWVFVDYQDLLDAAPQVPATGSRKLALVALAERQSISSRGVSADRMDAAESFLISATIPCRGYFSWLLDERGELSASGGIDLLSVRDIFSAAHKELEYELVRLAHVMRFYDLVVPITVVSQMPAQPRQRPAIMRAFDVVRSVRRRLITPEIIIPRLHALDDPNRILRELTAEVEQAEEETERRRVIRRHDVEGHIRRLPGGHHPSSKSRTLALERLGIVLAENETYVRKHERGHGERIGIHKAKRR